MKVQGSRFKVEGGRGVRSSAFAKTLRRDTSEFGDGIQNLLLPEPRTPNPESPRSQITNRKSQIGLTLIEVLLALVILGTGLVALVTAAGRCISVARQAKNYETARELLAMVEVTHPMLLEEEPEDIAGNGSFDEYPGFRWTREIVQEGFEEDGLWRVTTTINWTENKSARNEQVVELIYWPEGQEGGSVERR